MPYNQNKLVGVDRLGRLVTSVKTKDNGKQVGCFFWLWLGQPFAGGVWDAAEILKMENGTDILYHQDKPGVSPNGQPHWWGKPLWGYYNSDDKWVIRKQLEMLSSAGVDFIYFDATNARTYPQCYMPLMEIVEEMIAEGNNPPRCAFYTHTHSINTVRTLYKELYSKGLYSNAWYRIDGKPFIIAFSNPQDDIRAEEITLRVKTDYNPGELEPEIRDFFCFRRPQWPCNETSYADGFPWIEWIYPQPLHTDVISVTVASHPNVPMSFTRTRGLENWGRGWDPEKKINQPDKCEEGHFFQLQWDNALAVKDKLNFVSVGGWNEWIAYKQLWGGEYMLCDAADMELSRDIEPMEGGYEDNFYLQLIRNVRAFKDSGEPLEDNGRALSCDINKPDSFNGADLYVKIGQKPSVRDSYGCTRGVRYTATAARNTLNRIYVANDNNNLYFRIDAHNNFVPFSACDNTCLYLGTGTPALKGYFSYEYLLKRIAEDKMALYTLNENGAASFIKPIDCAVNGVSLAFAIAKEDIKPCDTIYFKATDSIVMDDIMNTYTAGSAMPMGRLSYEYRLK